MNAHDAARKIVNDWWKTQSFIIPVGYLQNPLIAAIESALTHVHNNALDSAKRAVLDVPYKPCEDVHLLEQAAAAVSKLKTEQ